MSRKSVRFSLDLANCGFSLVLTVVFLFSLFHAGQAAIKLPSGEASKRAQCTSQDNTPYITEYENSLELNTN